MKVQFEQDMTLSHELLVIRAREKTKVIHEAIHYIETLSDTIIGTVEEKNVIVPVQEFLTFYSSQKKVFGVTEERELSIKYRLYELENLLPSNFIRISNTEIINLNCVKEFSLTKQGIILITFKNGYVTSSSRRFLKKVKERLLC